MRGRKAIIWEAPDADPVVDRIRFGEGDDETVLVAVPEPSEAIGAARRLVEEGAENIELCGAFGPLWQARVAEEVGDEVRVGAIAYGFESITSVADYKARFSAGEKMREAFVVLRDGTARDIVERVEREGESATTTLVAAPNTTVAAKAARDLAYEGAQLIEVYGRPDAKTVAEIIEAVEAKVPVGFAGYEGGRTNG